jgi:hypothetical protein
MHRSKMLANELFDGVRLMEPLLVCAALVLDHRRESVELTRNPARERILAHEMDEPQKWRKPRFHNHDAAVRPKDAAHFVEGLCEIFRQSQEMMQAALHDQYIAAAILERQFAAIGGNDFGGSGEFGKQARRTVDAFDAGKSEFRERLQSAASSAKEFDDFGVARPLFRAQPAQAFHEFLNFFLRTFEAQVSGFPGVGNCSSLQIFGRSFGHRRDFTISAGRFPHSRGDFNMRKSPL